MHRDNLVADGAQPVLIDLETLWHLQERLGASDHPTGRTVLRTGFLPQRGSSGGTTYEWSALSGHVDSGLPLPHYLPVLGGQAYSASDFLPDILSGFRWIGQRVFKDRLFTDGLRRWAQVLARCRRRRILRSTSWYRSMVERLVTPSSLRDVASFTAACKNDGQDEPPITEQERSDLLQIDVPYIEQRTDKDQEVEAGLPVPDLASFERQEAIIVALQTR